MKNINDFTKNPKVTILRLRNTEHYDGTNGKQIMDSAYYLLDKLILKLSDKFDFDTYNFTTKSIPTKKTDCRSDSKFNHLIESDYIIIPTENEFQYHMKGRISENIMGRSYCRLLNILDGFDKNPNKKRKVILITSDKADTIELFRDRTFNRSNYFVNNSKWEHSWDYENKTHQYNMEFFRLDESEFPGGLHHLKHLFMIDEWNRDKRVLRKKSNKKVDFVYWGTSKKKKVSDSAEDFEYPIKDWYNKVTGEYDGRYRDENEIKYRSSINLKVGVPSNDYRNTLLKKIKNSEELKSNMIGYFDSFKYDVKFDKSIFNVMDEISKGRATICFNWPGQWEHLTSRYNEALACDVVPLVWNGYDKNYQLVADDWQRCNSFEDVRKKLIELRDDEFRLNMLDKLKEKYYSVVKPIEEYEKIFEEKMLNFLDN